MGNAQEISLAIADQDRGKEDDDPFSSHLRRLAACCWPHAQEDDQDQDREELEPTCLDTARAAAGFHAVSPDRLSLRYPGRPRHAHDVGAAQADRPAPARRLLYYFEMTLRHAGDRNLPAIGFTPAAAKPCRQPGWEDNSCGYRADDGMLYRAQETGEAFGPTFTAGDTVGAGINYATQEFFFTKNGNFIGAVPKNTKEPLYPTVSVHSQNEEVTVNFGKHPFLFNIEAYALEERTKQLNAIEKAILPVNVSHWIVRSYLLHYGYEDTLNSFDTAMGDSCQPAGLVQENNIRNCDLYAVNHRKILRQLIRSGEIDSAVEKLQQWYPQTVQNETNTLCFLLRSQKFIEYIRIGELEDAVKFARAHLAHFFSIKSLRDLLQNCIALLAYDQPAVSCVGYLLDANQRELVADAVNAAVLLTNPALADRKVVFSSHLEKLLRQLTACSAERRARSGDEGETFHLHQALHAAGRT